MESLPGYDNWKTTEPRPTQCEECGCNPCACCCDCGTTPCVCVLDNDCCVHGVGFDEECEECEDDDCEEPDEERTYRYNQADDARACNREHARLY